MKRLLCPYSSFIKFLYNEGHKSLFMSKFYFPKVKILYLHLDPKLGTIFAPRETLVLEMQFWVKFSINFVGNIEWVCHRNNSHIVWDCDSPNYK